MVVAAARLTPELALAAIRALRADHYRQVKGALLLSTCWMGLIIGRAQFYRSLFLP